MIYFNAQSSTTKYQILPLPFVFLLFVPREKTMRIRVCIHYLSLYIVGRSKIRVLLLVIALQSMDFY